MMTRLRIGDRVLSDAQGGWKPGEVVEVYGRWPMRMYGIRFVTAMGDVTTIYHRHNLRKLTEPKRG